MKRREKQSIGIPLLTNHHHYFCQYLGSENLRACVSIDLAHIARGRFIRKRFFFGARTYSMVSLTIPFCVQIIRSFVIALSVWFSDNAYFVLFCIVFTPYIPCTNRICAHVREMLVYSIRAHAHTSPLRDVAFTVYQWLFRRIHHAQTLEHLNIQFSRRRTFLKRFAVYGTYELGL